MSRYTSVRPIMGQYGGTRCEHGKQLCYYFRYTFSSGITSHEQLLQLLDYNRWTPLIIEKYYVLFDLEYSTTGIKQFYLCREHWADLLLYHLNTVNSVNEEV